MFSSTLQNFNLLTRDPDVGILQHFLFDTKRVVVASVLSDVSSNLQILSNFHTPNRLSWLLECIGASFTLPPTDHLTIAYGISLYENWFINSNDVPQPLIDNRTYYDQIALAHLTNLFTPREGNNDNLQHFTSLVLRAINIIRSIVIRHTKYLKLIDVTKVSNDINHSIDDTVSYALSCLLAATDDVCQVNNLPGVPHTLIYTLYETWLNSSSINTPHVPILVSRHPIWCKFPSISSALIDVTQHIQHSLIKALSEQKSSSELLINTKELQVTAVFTIKNFVSLWNMFLHFCGAPSNFNTLETVSILTNGLSQLTNEFIDCVTSSQSKFNPTGITVARIFANPFIYNVVALDHMKYFEPVSTSLKTLGSLLTKTYKYSNFSLEFYSSIYLVMVKALLSLSPYVVLSGFVVLTDILPLSLPGHETLYPSILRAAAHIANRADSNSKELRKQCILVLQLLQCTFSKERQSIVIKELNTTTLFKFSDFSQLFFTTMLTFLQTETSPTTLDDIFLLLARFFLQDSSKSLELDYLSQFLPLFNKYLPKWISQIKPSSFITLMNTLHELVIPHPDLSHSILDILESYIDFTYKTTPILSDLFNIFCLFLHTTYPSLPHQKFQNLLGLCQKIYAWHFDKSHQSSPISNFKQTCPVSLYTAISMATPFSETKNSELEFLNLNNDSSEVLPNVHCFFHANQTIITVLQLSTSPQTLYLFIRTPFSKEFRKVVLNLPNNTFKKVTSTPINDTILSSQPVHNVSWISKYPSSSLTEICKAESVTYQPTKLQPNLQNTIIPQQSIITTNSLIRLLLSSINLPLQSYLLQCLPVTSSLLQSLEQLDSYPTRSQISVVIIHDTELPSPLFNGLLRSLGRISKPPHNHFKGEYSNDDSFLYHYATGTEIVFHVNTLPNFPKNSIQSAHLIVYSYSYSSKDAMAPLDDIPSKHVIVLHPTSADAFHISTSSPHGVLLSEQLASPSATAALIRTAALQLSKEQDPTQQRSQFIDQIYRKHQNIQTNIYGYMLFEDNSPYNRYSIDLDIQNEIKEEKAPKNTFLSRKTPKPKNPTTLATSQTPHKRESSIRSLPFLKKKKKDDFM
ncbi:Ral GTPase-activating protein subunit alpha/beta N-terminal domain-containing protein [Entamoeba marina]